METSDIPAGQAPPGRPGHRIGRWIGRWRLREVLGRPLPENRRFWARLLTRFFVALFGPWITLRGAEHLDGLDEPVIFAFNHNNSLESILAPAVLLFERRGRSIRFMVDWMYLHIPVLGFMIGLIDPIPIYNKPAKFRLFDGYRLRRKAGSTPVSACAEALLAGDSIGIFPEGTRNRRADTLLKGRAGLGNVVLLSGAPVVPVGIHYPAAQRLGRIPKVGRMELRIGPPLEFPDQREGFREWVERSSEDAPAGQPAPAGAAALEAPATLEPSLEPSSPERLALQSREGRALGRSIVDRVMDRLADLSGKAYPHHDSRTHLRQASAQRPPAAASTPPITESSQQLDPGRAPNVSRAQIVTSKVLTPQDRQDAMRVIDEVFRQEKNWISSSDAEIPLDIADNHRMSWFVTRVGDRPAGVIRLAYDPPLELPPELELKLDYDIDMKSIGEGRKFVEIGRFMIIPEYRRNIRVALSLMKGSVREVLERGYTHFLTDVYESDPHSPLGFHTRVLGFERLGTHRYGELNCDSVRILLVLDIARAYQRLMVRKDRVYREMSSGLEELIEALPFTKPIIRGG